MKTMHEQVEISVRGKAITVDKRVRDLIVLLNNFPGVETFYSCQGDEGEEGYVQFGGDRALALLPKLAAGILGQEQLWRRKHHHICRGCRSMSVSLDVCGSGICLRWARWDYGRVLRMVKMMLLEPQKPKAKLRHRLRGPCPALTAKLSPIRRGKSTRGRF
jgi:hypothetical protein